MWTMTGELHGNNPGLTVLLQLFLRRENEDTWVRG